MWTKLRLPFRKSGAFARFALLSVTKPGNGVAFSGGIVYNQKRSEKRRKEKMNPIAFSIGSLTIYWYSLFILSGFILGYFFAYNEIKKHNLSKDFLADYFFYFVPIVILGARL